MATSPDLQIADKITTAIDAEVFSMAFDAERVYQADWDVKEELESLQVAVWPAEASAEAWERRQLSKTYRIGISFAKRVSKLILADVDALPDLVNEVAEFLELTTVTLDDGRQYVNQGWEFLLRFDDSRLNRNKDADSVVRYTGLFASVIVFEFTSLE